jgi:hypothetical protein
MIASCCTNARSACARSASPNCVLQGNKQRAVTAVALTGVVTNGIRAIDDEKLLPWQRWLRQNAKCRPRVRNDERTDLN